ncbi:hypothetical protein FHR71_004167 [Methylobacterium sp. RAS18]|nr:hypothetical protein [Methylobacterium sp. RAS18]
MKPAQIFGWIDASPYAGDWPAALPDMLNALSKVADEPSLYDFGTHLWYSGRSRTAAVVYNFLFETGYRNENFLRDYVGLLTGEMDYGKLDEVCHVSLTEDPDRLRQYMLLLLGQADLARRYSWTETLSLASQRERRGNWLNTVDIYNMIEEAIDQALPFSLIRLGDGEAKALVYYQLRNKDALSIDRINMIGNNIWQNWFGKDITDIEEHSLNSLFQKYFLSISNATVLATVTEQRYRSDTSHFGYMAHQEYFLDSIKYNGFMTDSMVHYQLNSTDCFLEKLLKGRTVSFVSPFYDLADRYSIKVGCNVQNSFVVPGERRLPSQIISKMPRQHYPDVFDELSVALARTLPGEVVLVAAGFLGKIYCNIIKDAGGIAIDIGSIVDGWMGHNTRPGHLDNAKTLL